MKPIKVLFLASEVFPFAKTNSVADVAGAFPLALKDLGHEARVIMPKYKLINERKYILREVIRLRDIEIPMGRESKKISVKSAFIPDSKVQIYFIDYKSYFNRNGLYTDSKTGKEYKDNDSRFILYCKGVFETLKHLFWQPDVIHCNDWQTSLVPLFLKTIYRDDPFFKKTGSILTIHNPDEQGIFKKDIISLFGLPEETFDKKLLLTDGGKVNFLKIGIEYADYVTTVSENYAREMQTSEELGFGLQEVLKKKKDRIFGILNGVDYNIWNPENDELIPVTYSSKTIAQKEDNKKALLKKSGLPYNPDVPVIGYISRLTASKGMDLFCKAIPQLSKLDAQFIVLGTGERKYSQQLSQAKKKYADKFNVHLTFNVALSHLIEAGADMILMPSRIEPCGVTLLYSLKYGTVPVVRRTGGMVDTIKNFDAASGKGNGFSFVKFEVPDMIDTLKSAIGVFQDKSAWKVLVKNCMKENHSWGNAGKKYLKLYGTALKNA